MEEEKFRPLLRGTERRYLRYDFSEAEIREIGKELGRQIHHTATLENELKSISKEFAAKIQQSKTSSSSLAQQVTNGYEYREVKCEVYEDPNSWEIFIVRPDTGEEIERRAMTADERQTTLFAPGKAGELIQDSVVVIDQ